MNLRAAGVSGQFATSRRGKGSFSGNDGRRHGEGQGLEDGTRGAGPFEGDHDEH